MVSPTTTTATLWGIWLLGWLISARATAKTVVEQPGTSLLAYSVFIWAGAILLFFHPGSLDALMRPWFPRKIWIIWTGVGLVAIGLGFAAWARLHLGRLWSGRVTLKEHHQIIRTGPYAFVRHPIYTGLVLALVGTALAKHRVDDQDPTGRAFAYATLRRRLRILSQGCTRVDPLRLVIGVSQ